MGRTLHLRITALLLAVFVPVALAGCSAPRVTGAVATANADSADDTNTAIAPSLTLSPASNAKRVPVSAEIGTEVAGGNVVSVALTSSSGAHVSGSMRPDGSSWVPAAPLKYDQSYTAQVIASSAAGKIATKQVSFRTMAAPASTPISASLNLTDGATYGVGMPVVVDFGAAIPRADRATVERRLFVTSVPATLGAWRWYTDRQVMYRPESYWKPGTQVWVRLALGGLPIGGRVFDKDHTANVTIGRDFEITVTNSNHMLTVTSDGAVLKRDPISMGKPSTPSWSGHFVIIERDYYTVFDTLGEPGGYRIPVNYAERLTWSGTFIHSAPWSVYAQGHMNVSHGCVNVGPANAAWIYKYSKIGDPVSISGTPIHAAQGNGWTIWDMSWADYVRGSALPAPTLQVPRARPAL